MEQPKDYVLTRDDIEFLISCACRYNIGRCTYSPHMFIDIVEKNIDALSDRCIWWILDDISKEQSHLGMPMDEDRWLKLKVKLEAKRQKA